MAINNPVIADAGIIQDTAVAIQEKDHGGKMEFPDIPSRIRALPTNLIPKTITQNGVYNASSDNADGYDVVTVGVPQTLAGQIVDGSITEYVNNNIQSIRDYAFCNCTNLHTIVADNVITVGNSAFKSCSSLTNIKLKNVIIIEGNAFRSISNNSKAIFKNVKTLKPYAFYGTEYSALDVRSIERIENYALIRSDAFYDLTNVDDAPILDSGNFYAGRTTGVVAVKNDVVKQNFLNATNWSNVTIIKTIAEIEAEVGMSYDDYYYQIFGESRNEV